MRLFAHSIFFVIMPMSIAFALNPPVNVVARSADQLIVLHWDSSTDPGIVGYNVYRRAGLAGSFSKMNQQRLSLTGFADVTVHNDTTYFYYVTAVSLTGQESDSSNNVSATPHLISDDELLDFLEHAAVDFFWYEANPLNGLIKDISTSDSPCSIASVGFGLTSICIGIDRGWIPSNAGKQRVLNTLKTFWTLPQGEGSTGYAGYRGFFYHFLDMKTGLRARNSELSSIDTGLLLAGVLYVRQFFNTSDSVDQLIRSLADSIYERVDWRWMEATANHGGIYMQWTPENKFNDVSWWKGYCEAMIMNTLAAGSSTHPANGGDLYLTWTSGYQWGTYYGYSYVIFPPLFGHQYSHCWIDYRYINDPWMSRKGITYFENSKRATLANRSYCAANPGRFLGYSDSVWGLTACDGPPPSFYMARGGPPGQNDDGTIAPTAAAGSIPFTPKESIQALRAMYNNYRSKLATPYGFADAFNPTKGWFDDHNIGIDQGPIAIMIENYRTGRIWNVFMQNKNIQAGLRALYFSPVTDVRQNNFNIEKSPHLLQNYPNPFNPTTTVQYIVPRKSHVIIKIYDILGRQLEELYNGEQLAGTYSAIFNGINYPGGIYFCSLNVDGSMFVQKMILVK